MPGVIVECAEHGFVESRQITHSGGAQGIIVDSTASCPLCGRRSPVVTGMYSQTSRGRLRAELLPTPAQAARLRTVLVWAQEEIAQPDADQDRVARALEREIGRNVPALATMLDAFRGSTSSNLAAWVAVLLAVLMWITSGNGISADDVERIVDETVRSVQSEREPGEPGDSSTPGPPQPSPQPATEIPTPKTR